MAEPTVRMSGIVLASLMFQHVNSESDVEGFILGESKFEEQVTINDSQADHIHIEETYNIQKHVACHQLNSFYNSVGAVDIEAVKRLLADNKQERVIGWYRQRRNSEQVMSLREKVVHENLKAALSNPHVVFVLLTPSKMTSPGSTHRTEYAAFISRSRTFLNVPVLVNNLGLLEQLSYWKVSAPCSSAGYNLTMKKHGSKFFSSNGLLREVNEVNKMNESLQVELQKTCRDVEESEREVETLQVEVAALRSRVREKRRSQKGVKQVEDDDGPKKKNLLLQEAVRALFSCSSLFHSQTLTLNAFPVPAVCCGAERHDEDVEDDEGEDVVSVLDAVKPQERLSRMNFRKRLSEATEQRERKRRKNQNC